jgi:hypothetical protein
MITFLRIYFACLFLSILLIIFSILKTRGYFSDYINQYTEYIGNGRFEVKTFCWYKGSIIFYEFTWQKTWRNKDNERGVSEGKIDSARNAHIEHIKAVINTIKKYN